TFSTCFAAPFLPLEATRYSQMLSERMKKHCSTVWLINTGWTAGAYGQGRRISLGHTRMLVQAALSGALANAPYVPDAVFGVAVPKQCPGVPAELLQPRGTWKDPAEYDGQAQQLASLFREQFKQYAARVSESVRQSGPRA